jgi:predicted nucleotidyltransferase
LPMDPLFGSVLRDDFRYDSDVDILVKFAPDSVSACSRKKFLLSSYGFKSHPYGIL